MDYYSRFRKLTPEEEAERDLALFGEYDPGKYCGGIRTFQDVDPETVAKLIGRGFADPDEEQNNAPSIQEFLDFCAQHPQTKYTLGGYAVTRERPDCRVSVDQIRGEYRIPDGTPVSDVIEEILAFYERFRIADDVEVTPSDGYLVFYAWFD